MQATLSESLGGPSKGEDGGGGARELELTCMRQSDLAPVRNLTHTRSFSPTGQDSLANERRANGRDAPFKVPYIGIGNESWGCGGNMTPEYYSNELRRFGALFHKNGTNFHQDNDNNAMRVGSGANNLDTNWTDVVTQNAGHHLDAISLHFYTVLTGDWMNRNRAKATGFPAKEWNGILFQAMRMEETSPSRCQGNPSTSACSCSCVSNIEVPAAAQLNFP